MIITSWNIQFQWKWYITILFIDDSNFGTKPTIFASNHFFCCDFQGASCTCWYAGTRHLMWCKCWSRHSSCIFISKQFHSWFIAHCFRTSTTRSTTPSSPPTPSSSSATPSSFPWVDNTLEELSLPSLLSSLLFVTLGTVSALVSISGVIGGFYSITFIRRFFSWIFMLASIIRALSDWEPSIL